MPRKPIDLSNKRFGKLLVLEITPERSGGSVVWKCICDCGNYTKVTSSHLVENHTKSCGCLQIESVTNHGLRNTLEYGIWCSILQRCLNPNDPSFHLYGGRGITVCDRWKKSFENFYEDIGKFRPDNKFSIDRNNTDGNYEPNNCSWVTAIEQANNRRNNVIFNLDGEDLTVAEIARKVNIPYKRLKNRLDRGWNFVDAIKAS